jgi:Glutamine amidotransferases class-II
MTLSRVGSVSATRIGHSNRLGIRQARVLYTTESIIEKRSGRNHNQLPRTLYDAKNEKENCGVGLIASLKSVPSRSVVERADEMLVRMAHRGGCGCDPASGDGSGQY